MPYTDIDRRGKDTMAEKQNVKKKHLTGNNGSQWGLEMVGTNRDRKACKDYRHKTDKER